MVGAGTGIAPFRSFWQERKIDMEMMQVPSGANGTGWGKLYLYFGCRQSKLDELYSNELEQLVKEKVITNLYLAFSREPSKRKVNWFSFWMIIIISRRKTKKRKHSKIGLCAGLD